ncbi:unnamed protein product, partial [Effrenium voratum]
VLPPDQLQELPLARLVSLSQSFAKLRDRQNCEFAVQLAVREPLPPKALAQLSWSLATSRTQDTSLVTACVFAGDPHDGFEARDLAAFAWAVAKLSDVNAKRILPRLLQQAVQKLSCFSPQDVSTFMWAYAKCHIAKDSLCEAAFSRFIDLAEQFSPQGLANLSWAFATLTFHSGLEACLQEVYKRGLAENTPQAVSILAWCCAANMQPVTDQFSRAQQSVHLCRFEKAGRCVLHIVEKEVALRIAEFSAQGLSNIAWAFSSTTALSAPFAQTLGNQVLAQADLFPLQPASNTCWAFAAAKHVDPTVFLALSRRLQHLLRLRPQATRRPMEVEVCASAWAFKSATLSDAKLDLCVRSALLRFGQVQDNMRVSKLSGLSDCDVEELQQEVAAPKIMLDLSDRMVIRKPYGWVGLPQVRGTRLKAIPALSDFLASKQPCAIFSDTEHQCGMIHRLDVPNSGLLLAAKTYAAYYDLMYQLNVGMVLREYVVLCHGWIPWARREIAAPLCWDDKAAPSHIARHGKPSSSSVKVLSHLLGQLELGAAAAPYSLVEVSIKTGRRHQIRSHFAFIGHPLVGDAKYSSSMTFLSDHSLCKRNFLHRFRLVFLDREEQTVEVVDDLPADLQHAMSKLSPKDEQSKSALQHFRRSFHQAHRGTQ